MDKGSRSFCVDKMPLAKTVTPPNLKLGPRLFFLAVPTKKINNDLIQKTEIRLNKNKYQIHAIGFLFLIL